jgi:hypothetical protein
MSHCSTEAGGTSRDREVVEKHYGKRILVVVGDDLQGNTLVEYAVALAASTEIIAPEGAGNADLVCGSDTVVLDAVTRRHCGSQREQLTRAMAVAEAAGAGLHGYACGEPSPIVLQRRKPTVI